MIEPRRSAIPSFRPAVARAVARRLLLALPAAIVAVQALGGGVGFALNPRAYVASPASPGPGTLRVIEWEHEIMVTPPFVVGEGPSDVAVHPEGTRVYVADRSGNTLTIVDPIDRKTRQVADPEGALSGPGYLAISPRGDRLYVSNTAARTVSVVDTESERVLSTTRPLGPSGSIGMLIAIRAPGVGPLVFVAHDAGELVVLDGDGNPIGRVPLPRGVQPFALGRHPSGRRVYVTSDSSIVAVVPTDTGSFVADPRYLPGGSDHDFRTRGIDVALTSRGPRLVIAVQNPNSVRVYPLAEDLSTLGECKAAYRVGADPLGVSVSADGTIAYVVSRQQDRAISLIYTRDDNPNCDILVDDKLRLARPVDLLPGGAIQAFGRFTAPGVTDTTTTTTSSTTTTTTSITTTTTTSTTSTTTTATSTTTTATTATSTTTTATSTTTTTSTVSTTSTTTTTMNACGNGQVDTAQGEQCDTGVGNGAPGSCCDAACRFLPADAVCRVALAACDENATCNGVSATCPANPKKADGELCDDGAPGTTSACRNDVCQGVDVVLGIPPVREVPPDAVPFTVEITDGGSGKARVVMQGFANCSELPPVPSDCSTSLCRFIRRELTADCGTTATGTTLAAGQRRMLGNVTVTKRFSSKFGRKRSSGQGELKLNKLGRALLAQSGSLPLQTRATVQDRRGATLTALFRTLLRLR